MPPVLMLLIAVAAIHSPYIAIWFAQRRWPRVRRIATPLVLVFIVAEFLIGMTLMLTL